jgi:hypothetical protein
VTPALLEEYCEKFRNWGRWGPDDEIGTLNLITPEVITRAAGLVKQGKVISCALNFDTDGSQTGACLSAAAPRHGGQHGTAGRRDLRPRPLGQDCAADHVYEFMFVAPLSPVTRAVGSPINPQAIK